MKASIVMLFATVSLGAAQAQSLVAVAGTVDLSVKRVENGDLTWNGVGTDGLNSSQLVFRGREDLGSGLWAGFVLNAGVNADTGTANGKFWNRRSTVSLGGTWGELRIGRDYVPTFWNTTLFEPFGTVGVGSFMNVVNVLGSGAGTQFRADNSIGYFLPSNLGGVYGQFMVSAGEGVVGNKYWGGRLGYAGGPVDVAVSSGSTRATGGDNYKLTNVGGSYDFGVAKLMAQYYYGKYAGKSQKVAGAGVAVPLGQAEIKASFATANYSGAGTDANDAHQFALGYVYHVSKRTALYGTASHLSNKGVARFSTDFTTPDPSAGGFNSKGYETGVRHATSSKVGGLA